MVELNPDIILAEGERIEPNKGEATDVLLIRAIVRAKETGKSVNVIWDNPNFLIRIDPQDTPDDVTNKFEDALWFVVNSAGIVSDVREKLNAALQ